MAEVTIDVSEDEDLPVEVSTETSFGITLGIGGLFLTLNMDQAERVFNELRQWFDDTGEDEGSDNG